jgi:lipopolysaccharide transport system ATP-binding protein
MASPVIRVESLGKRYVLDKAYKPAEGIVGRARQSIAGSFDWLIQQIKEPSPEQVLWAVKDVSFQLEKGEVLGIIGRNGAGKSTLLKLLSRITEPSAGFAEIRGRIGALLEVGTGMHPELTGRENTYLNGTLLGMSKNEVDANFNDIVAFSGIGRLIDTPVKRYSSGMRVRLGFAIAAHLEPEVLVIDEVLAVGDAEFQRKCLGKIKGTAKNGRTVLFVSHNMDAVRRLCTRTLVLEGGTVAFDGNTEAAISHYLGSGQEAQTEYAIVPPEGSEELLAHVYKLCIEDLDGNPAAELPVGKPWQVRMLFNVQQPIQSFVAALTLRSETHGIVGTTWSSPEDLSPGRYSVVFKEETIHLAPGRYSLLFGLSVGQVDSIHYVEDAAILEIQDYSIVKPVPRLQGGVYANQMDSKITKVS